jgi:hypothetical protein
LIGSIARRSRPRSGRALRAGLEAPPVFVLVFALGLRGGVAARPLVRGAAFFGAGFAERAAGRALVRGWAVPERALARCVVRRFPAGVEARELPIAPKLRR